MDQDQSSGEDPEREETRVDLEPIRKTYDAAIKVLKLGRRWLKTRPFGMVGSGLIAESLFYTYMDTYQRELAIYRTLYGYSGELAAFISRTRPVFDALDFLDQTIYGIRVVGMINAEADKVASLIERLGIACEILGEVLDDLEAEENAEIRPEWNREAKQLWVGEILCREYLRKAPSQFDILDAFHERDWPRSIPNPFRSEKQLRDTKDDLNQGLAPGSPIKLEIRGMRPAWFQCRPRSGSS